MSQNFLELGEAELPRNIEIGTRSTRKLERLDREVLGGLLKVFRSLGPELQGNVIAAISVLCEQAGKNPAEAPAAA